MPRVCEAQRKDGAPCTTRVLGDGRFCFAHDPAAAAKRAEVRRRGGENRATAKRTAKLIPATLKPVLAQLLDALDETHRGTLDPKVAGALAALAGAIVKVYQQGQLEERLQALEQAYHGQGRTA